MSKEPKSPKLAVDHTRTTSLLWAGTRFLVLGTFPGTTQLEIEKNSEQLGGILLTKAKAQVSINNHSVTPNVILLQKMILFYVQSQKLEKINQLDKFRMRDCCKVLQG